MKKNRPSSIIGNESIILLPLFLCLVACSNPQNYEVAKLTNEQRTTVHQILTAEQLDKLDSWIYRNATTRQSVPRGVTVQQALRDQDVWLANKKIGDTKADQLRKQTQAERAARQEELSRVLTVSVVSKKNQVQEDERRFVALDIAYESKTGKPIQGVQGILRFSDIYGNAIIDVSRSYDHEISPKQTAIDREVCVSINQLNESEVNLWNTDFDKLRYTFEAHTITFKDGTHLSVPK